MRHDQTPPDVATTPALAAEAEGDCIPELLGREIECLRPVLWARRSPIAQPASLDQCGIRSSWTSCTIMSKRVRSQM